MNRRTFLQSGIAASLAVGASGAKPPICIFSKHMAQFDYEELAQNAKAIGFDGVDLTVRPKGHVLPERVADDLPKAVEAIRARGLSVPMITTDIKNAEEAATRPILSTAARLKIPFWKLGYHSYKLDQTDAETTLSTVRKITAGLAALSKEHGITGGFHNHSGANVGSAVWDIRAIIENQDPRWIGYYFDPAHATIEGGLAGWRISQSIAAKRLKMVALKDFYWAKNNQGKWREEWCPMGEGMVDWDKVFTGFVKSGFSGPLTLHVEYHVKDELAAIAKDFEFVKRAVGKAYGS